MQVDKIRCFIHPGTLLADFTTILAGDNRFPKVTRGFQQTFTPSSFPQVVHIIQYNTITIPLRYNTIQCFLLSSSYQDRSAPYPWENFPSSQPVSPRTLVTVRCVLPLTWSGQWYCGIFPRLLVTVGYILSMPVILLGVGRVLECGARRQTLS